MGCLCSKSKKTSTDGVLANGRSPLNSTTQRDVYNVLQQNNPELLCIAEIILNAPSKQETSKSLVHYPPQNLLLCRSWIQKRGHVLRNWRKRYCVLDKTELKYYASSLNSPPYGKKLKGKLALLGAVCMVQESEDGKFIHVEIFGNLGDKDLFFKVDNNAEGKEFVRLLEWAFRKTTQTMILRNLKNNLSGLGRGAASDEKYSCEDWIRHEQKLYEAAILRLKQVQLVHFFHNLENGSIVLQAGIIQLWHAFGENILPGHETKSSEIGICWQLLEFDEYEETRLTGFSMSLEERKIFTCEDIADFTFQSLDKASSNYIFPRVWQLHHSDCNVNPYFIFTIRTAMGNDLHLLACCMNDYQGFLLALQTVLLYQERKEKNALAVAEIAKKSSRPLQASVELAMQESNHSA